MWFMVLTDLRLQPWLQSGIPSSMIKIVFLGDVVGDPGRDVVRRAIPILKEQYKPDFIIVNGENSAGGRGITPKIAVDLMRAGVDVITLGDHAWDNRDIFPFFAQEPRLIRPINYPPGTYGKGSVIVSGNGKKIAVMNAQGRTFLGNEVENPFLCMEFEIDKIRKETPCIFVDFHAEATSEKIAFGRFLDGKVTAVVGTHTHVQTADDQIFPGGTAYLTDAGFCGPHDSVIGRDHQNVIARYKTLLPNRFHIAHDGLQADGCCVCCDDYTGKAISIERIQLKLPLENQ